VARIAGLAALPLLAACSATPSPTAAKHAGIWMNGRTSPSGAAATTAAPGSLLPGMPPPMDPDEVYAIDTTSGRLLARIKVGKQPHGLCIWPQPGRYSLGHTGILR
jgi:hypothetical protein